MIKRIVRMTFQEDQVESFLKIFHLYKDQIRNQEGCHHLELWKDVNDATVFSTFSIWESEKHLNQYRYSETFGLVWPATKALFRAKPEAFSYQVEVKLS